MLIALVKERTGIAAHLLQEFGLTPETVRAQPELVTPRSDDGAVEPSTRTRILLETAAEEARGMRHGYVGTEHLLLACH